jgi:abortive infection bacteriophage resistance protein
MKPAKSINEMISLMESRGLTVTNHDEMRRTLFDGNYYRLFAFWRVRGFVFEGLFERCHGCVMTERRDGVFFPAKFPYPTLHDPVPS